MIPQNRNSCWPTTNFTLGEALPDEVQLMKTQSTRSSRPRDESSRRLESSKTNLKNAADNLVAAGTERVQQIKEAVAAHGQQNVADRQDRLIDWEKRITIYVRSKPLAAVTTALGIGLVLGVLRRR